jgi:hypothetical protein
LGPLEFCIVPALLNSATKQVNQFRKCFVSIHNNMSVSKSEADNTQQDAPSFSLDSIIKVGIRMHDNVPCVTYIRQPPNNTMLYSGPPTAQLHSYLPLPRKSIRLLMRVPQPDPDLLSFDFLTCFLDDINSGKLAYTAISYCWGDMLADRRLGIGGFICPHNIKNRRHTDPGSLKTRCGANPVYQIISLILQLRPAPYC